MCNLGTANMLGFSCDKFFYEEKDGQRTNKYTMWVRYVYSTKQPSFRQTIPVRYEMQGYSNLLNAPYDQYHLDYDSYVLDDIADNIFEVDQGS